MSFIYKFWECFLEMVSVGYEMVSPLGVIGSEFGVNWLKWLNEHFQRYKTISFRI